jgi:hypothetical protein
LRRVLVLQVLACAGLCLPLLSLGLMMACDGTCPGTSGKAGLEDFPGTCSASSPVVGSCGRVPSPLGDADDTYCACSTDACARPLVMAGSVVSGASQRLTVSVCFLRAWSAALCAPGLAPSWGPAIERPHPTPGLSHLKTVILLV